MIQEIDIINIFSHAGPMVKMVLLLLLFFSVTSWAIIIIKYRYIKKAYKESAAFTEFFWKSRNFSDAYSKSKQFQGSPIARVFHIGYLELRRLGRSGVAPNASQPAADAPSMSKRFIGSDTIKRALRRAANTEITRMTQMVPFLATTGNTTPFIGLFGTVWGIMNSFRGIGLKGSASLAVVAPGISEALIATAAGLAVAIPAVIAFNYFTQKIRVIESELHSFSADFLNIVDRDMLKVEDRRK
ncbi:MAG: protein TolQ [Desulfobacterales bacterium]|nr:protein TolQ [Desulfobacterales bacterium]MDJ0914908.1 protein TolQ [Desulfobacterales bacterium]